MPFDIGFNFRGSSGFVIDPSYGVPVIQEAFPHTYTAGNGFSINAGFTNSINGAVDRVNTNDPRIAGINFLVNLGATRTFQVDLSSGSAPGAGAYTLDCAFGDPSGAQKQDFQIADTSTVLIDGTNGGVGFATAAGHFIDATGTDIAASTTWTGTTVSKTFVTTTANVVLNPDLLTTGADSVTVAHFRLTLAGGTSTDITPGAGSITISGYQPTLTGQMTIVTVFSNLGDQGFIAFQASSILKVEASLDGVTYYDITALGRAVTGAILFSDVAFLFYRVTSVGAIVYTTGTDKVTLN